MVQLEIPIVAELVDQIGGGKVNVCAERSEAKRIFNEARAKRAKRVKIIEWASLVVDVTVCSISFRGIHRE